MCFTILGFLLFMKHGYCRWEQTIYISFGILCSTEVVGRNSKDITTK